MKLVPLGPNQAFPLRPEQRASFAGPASPFSISGPPGLARLVQRGRNKLGEFWFDETVFTRLRAQAKQDLAQQGIMGGGTGTPHFRRLVGLYMKFCLRSDLAICKNWTADFDSYVILPLRPQDAVVAWAGAIKAQPYFSEPSLGEKDHAEKKAAYDLAAKGGVHLLGGQQQFIIDFTFPANLPQAARVLGPFEF